MQADALTFASPEMFWLLPGVLVLVAWAVVQHMQRGRQLARLGTGAVLARMTASFSPERAAVRIALWGAALTLLALAAAQPRYGLRETEVSNAGIDLAIVVDASKSMLVKDVVPNRLQGAALEVSSLLGKLAGGRVALVPFAGIPFVQCPLTTDHDVVRTYLADLKPEDLPVGGTNIGRALTLASEALTGERERAEAELRDNLVPQFKGSKHKAIVLFSDGEDHEGAALEAAQKAAAAGIRIYTVGVGSAFGDPVPVLGPDGSAIGVVKDEAGNPVFSKLNQDLLKQIATTTGGSYFHYANTSVAQPLFQALDALEKAEYTAQFKLLGEDRYQYLLAPALLLLLIDAALTNRRRKREAKVSSTKAAAKGTGPDSKANAAVPTKAAHAPAIAAVLLMMATSGVASPALAVPSWLERENPDVAEGRELLAAKPGEALKAFQEAQQTRPEHVIIWYNLGLAQAALSQHAEAVTSLSRALGGIRTRDAALEADVHYAMGTGQLSWARQLEALDLATAPKPAEGAHPTAKDPTSKDPAPLDPAPAPAPPTPPAGGANPAEAPLPHYRAAVVSLEAALLADPTRKATRFNLELARLGAWPTCRSRDKAHEPNDQPEKATKIAFEDGAREQVIDLRACPEDRDLFQVTLLPGDRFSAKLTTKADPTPAGEPEDGAATAPARLGLQLLDATGNTQLRGPAADAPPLDAVDLGKVDSAQSVLVDVRNVAEVETAYDLTLKLLPGCARIEDKFEPNDTPDAARALTIGQPAQGRLCPLNDDYFAVALQPGQGIAAKVKAKIDAGADHVELDILDPEGRVVASGRKAKEGYAVRMPFAVGMGTYVVRVRGSLDTEADYELALEVLPPCRDRDDRFEDNDQAVQANPLSAELLQSPLDPLQLCPGDDDWFAVELKAGESLFVDLSAAVEDLPDAADLAGAVTVEVYDDKGIVWGRAIGGPVAGSGSVMRTAAVLAPPPGTYRVRVTGGGVAAPVFPLPVLPEGSVQLAPGTMPSPGVAPGTPQLPDPQADPNAPPPGAPGDPNQPPPPPPVPHVVLPPELPLPLVNPEQALLDLPYTLKLRILPPCPEGNDELEPNDAAGAAKPVEVGNEQLMRICKGDQDWLQVTQKAGQALQVGARYDLSHGPLRMEAFDEAGTTSIAKGAVAGPDAKAVRTPADDTPEARKGRTATTGLALPAPKADRVLKIRVAADAGVENFYVFRVEEPPPPSDKGENDEQKQDEQEKDDEKDEDEKKEDEKKEGEKKQEPKPGEEDKPKPDKADQERLKQQMQRNDHNPSNLEAQEALRKSPFRNSTPQKDW